MPRSFFVSAARRQSSKAGRGVGAGPFTGKKEGQAQALAKLNVRQWEYVPTPVTIWSQSEQLFDAFGRPWKSNEMRYSGGWSYQETGYDAMGRKSFVSRRESATTPASKWQVDGMVCTSSQ